MNCLFCQFANREKGAEMVYRDDQFFVFKDINPKARIHLLIIPRKHIESVNDIGRGDAELAGGLFLTAQRVAQQLGVKDLGYRLQVNVGRGGGQIIDHLHVHLLAD